MAVGASLSEPYNLPAITIHVVGASLSEPYHIPNLVVAGASLNEPYTIPGVPSVGRSLYEPYNVADSLFGDSVVRPRVVCSMQLSDVFEDQIYVAIGMVTLKQGTICNVSGTPVAVSMSVLKNGDVPGLGIHRILSSKVINPGDTLSLKSYFKSLVMESGDSIMAQASAATAIDIVLSGIENTISGW